MAARRSLVHVALTEAEYDELHERIWMLARRVMGIGSDGPPYSPYDVGRDDADRRGAHLAEVRAAALLERAVRDRLDVAVRAAMRTGASYGDVGDALGVTRQAARKRWPGLAAGQAGASEAPPATRPALSAVDDTPSAPPIAVPSPPPAVALSAVGAPVRPSGDHGSERPTRRRRKEPTALERAMEAVAQLGDEQTYDLARAESGWRVVISGVDVGTLRRDYSAGSRRGWSPWFAGSMPVDAPVRPYPTRDQAAIQLLSALRRLAEKHKRSRRARPT